MDSVIIIFIIVKMKHKYVLQNVLNYIMYIMKKIYVYKKHNVIYQIEQDLIHYHQHNYVYNKVNVLQHLY